MNHLSSGDLDLKLNSLTLINSLIYATPSMHERRRLIFLLDRLRCNELLIESIDTRDDNFQTQLDVYVGLTQVRLQMVMGLARTPSFPDASAMSSAVIRPWCTSGASST